jgi:Cu-processing system permease protein
MRRAQRRALRAGLGIARRELGEALRSRWAIFLAAILTLLPLLISALGLGVHGNLALQGFARTSASMVNLAIYLVPLLGLVLAQGSIVGEAERGTLRLVCARPVARTTLVLGKFAGLCAAVTVLVGGSFLLGGALIAARVGTASAADYVAFTGSAILLAWSFVAIGLWLSARARDRAQAIAGSLAAWFFFAIVLDLVLLAGFILLSRLVVAPEYAPAVEVLHRELAGGHTGQEVRFPWVSGLVLCNPTDVFRLVNIVRMPSIRGLMALTRSMPAWLESPVTLSAASLLWIGLPLAAAVRRFRRLELD